VEQVERPGKIVIGLLIWFRDLEQLSARINVDLAKGNPRMAIAISHCPQPSNDHSSIAAPTIASDHPTSTDTLRSCPQFSGPRFRSVEKSGRAVWTR